MDARTRIHEIQNQGGKVTPDELDQLWTTLETVRPEEMLGAWKGSEFVSGHPFEGNLARVRWHGKTFTSLTDVTPLVCLDDEGNKYANIDFAKGGASLWTVEFRGEPTATMVYDGRPILDHFKRVDDATVLGVMNGKGVMADDGRHYYFMLERE
ncbi:hypothetical protein FB565_000553 [Actinoplanes lutulentus]|uniref:GXWXG protein n=1 Tax=Actinoplanes lutulentus TaxID=1287878 RepID=A0A327ZQH5_9ACTN|nr:DUF4334 domain-containing protein [Actinoplanes lutulentus]MBB2940849.1 hypothetical protein [Actinoplanes lutulentus]RAK43158.1 GXWXG protein [Actinoplanes lutulentus]